MIQRTPARIEAHLSDHEHRSWQQLLSESVTSPEELLRRLELPEELRLTAARQGHRLFPVRVPEPFLARMLARSGINFTRVGGDLEYHGIRAPYFTTTQQALDTMTPDTRAMYMTISEQIRTEYEREHR